MLPNWQSVGALSPLVVQNSHNRLSCIFSALSANCEWINIAVVRTNAAPVLIYFRCLDKTKSLSSFIVIIGEFNQKMCLFLRWCPVVE